MPDMIHDDIPVVLNSTARKAYEQLENDLLLQVDADTITAGSAGVLTGKLLQLCNGAIYSEEHKFGLTWSLEQYEQANKRLHRQGQEHPVIVHNLVSTGRYGRNGYHRSKKKE